MNKRALIFLMTYFYLITNLLTSFDSSDSSDSSDSIDTKYNPEDKAEILMDFPA